MRSEIPRPALGVLLQLTTHPSGPSESTRQGGRTARTWRAYKKVAERGHPGNHLHHGCTAVLSMATSDTWICTANKRTDPPALLLPSADKLLPNLYRQRGAP